MVLSLKRWKSRSSPGIEARAAIRTRKTLKTHSHVSYTQRLQAQTVAGWSSPVARQAHNLKVTGSNPVPATILDTLDITPPSQAALSFVHHASRSEALATTSGSGPSSVPDKIVTIFNQRRQEFCGHVPDNFSSRRLVHSFDLLPEQSDKWRKGQDNH